MFLLTIYCFCILKEIELECGTQLCLLFPPDESIDLYQVIHKMRHKRRINSQPRSRGRPARREPGRDVGRLEMFFGLLVGTCVGVTWRSFWDSPSPLCHQYRRGRIWNPQQKKRATWTTCGFSEDCTHKSFWRAKWWRSSHNL